MPDARSKLLAEIIDETAAHGLADRSLRELAAAVGSSHRMLLFHFGSRSGLVSAIVEATEAAQRAMMEDLAGQVASAGELIMRLWDQVSSPELRPLVRLFFECVALTGGAGLTDPWLEATEVVATRLGITVDPTEMRMGVALTRGLLIDVLATGDASDATRSLERLVEMLNL